MKADVRYTWSLIILLWYESLITDVNNLPLSKFIFVWEGGGGAKDKSLSVILLTFYWKTFFTFNTFLSAVHFHQSSKQQGPGGQELWQHPLIHPRGWATANDKCPYHRLNRRKNFCRVTLIVVRNFFLIVFYILYFYYSKILP